MKQSLIKIKVLLIIMLLGNASAFPSNIMVNQAGYLPKFPKFVFVSSGADSFFIKQAATAQIVFRGKLTLWKLNDPSTGLSISKGDFSSFKTPGDYYITTNLSDSSRQFSISDTALKDPYYKILKSYYFQRCGIFLDADYAGLYFHPPCHTNDGKYHSTTGLTGNLLSTGGWHDAGDFGKYVVNAGITVGTMLMAYETFPERFSQDNLNIPESGNKIPDILDEIKYELDWLFTMQNSKSGGVYAKLTRENFEGFVMPNKDTGDRYIYQIASTATADFAAVMARAYRVFNQFDTAYASKCIKAAEFAWTFLENNSDIVPPGGFKNPAGTGTGEYGDGNDRDERLWASAELFISTGKDTYHQYYKQGYSSNIFYGAMGWPSLYSMANLTYLFGKQPAKLSSIVNTLSSGLDTYCSNLVTKKGSNGLHVVIEPNDYNWGSNSEVLNRAILLIMGYLKSGKPAYFETALDQLNYVLGVNAYEMSYVTGIGSKSPMHIHHRPSASDGIFEPVPGLISGGPNKYLQDDVLPKYFNSSTPPAKCYIDDQGSYASNEIAINWNAPLVFVSGYFNGEGLLTSVKSECRSKILPGSSPIEIEQNYPNPFNGMTVIKYFLSRGQDVQLRVYDILGNLVLSKDLGFQASGSHVYQWNTEEHSGIHLSSGTYLFCLKSTDGFSVKKVNLLK